MIDYQYFEKGINKISNIVSNQKGVNDDYTFNRSQLNELEKSLNNLNKDEVDTKRVNDLKSRILTARNELNNKHKIILFAYDLMSIERINHDIYNFKGEKFKANGKVQALKVAMAISKTSDLDEFVANKLSLKKHNLVMSDLIELSRLKENKLKSMMLSNPWQFYLIIIGAAELKRRQDR